MGEGETFRKFTLSVLLCARAALGVVDERERERERNARALPSSSFLLLLRFILFYKTTPLT
jgi:hypothetical protein